MDLILLARWAGARTKETIAADMISFAYRSFALECHPDRGGDSKLFVTLGEARELLLEGLK